MNNDLTVVVEGELVEHPARWLLAHVLVDRLPVQLVQADRVHERLTGRLQRKKNISVFNQRVKLFSTDLESKGYVAVSEGEPLAVDRADRDPEVLGVVPGQLGDVAGHLAVVDGLALVVQRPDSAAKVLELGDDKLGLEGSGQEN